MNPITTAKLILNGNDRFSVRPGSYLNLIQHFQHHENVPTTPGNNVGDWAIRSQASTSVMIGYEEGSETRRLWVLYDGLINLIRLKV